MCGCVNSYWFGYCTWFPNARLTYGMRGQFRRLVMSLSSRTIAFATQQPIFLCKEWRQWELDVVFSGNKNCRTNVLYFTLYVRLLYGVGHIFGCFVFGFRVPKCHVYHSQARTLFNDVFMVKANREHTTYCIVLKCEILIS